MNKQCKICNSSDVKIVYNGKFRLGGVGTWIKNDTPVFKCNNCDVLWHDDVLDDIAGFYENSEYREAVQGNANIDKFYELHDSEVENRLNFTGTKIFRNKIVADIGCGGGAFLDYIDGVAKTIIAVEPSKDYRQKLIDKFTHSGEGGVYPYASVALKDWQNKVDIVTSFDVIEHVTNPIEFLNDIYKLLKDGGQAIIETPTNQPVTSDLLGEDYNKIIVYTAQHLWVFSENSLSFMAKKIGFSKCSFKYFQKWDLTNLLTWMKYKRPLSIGSNYGIPEIDINYDFVTPTLNEVYKKTLEEKGLADTIIMYLEK